MQRIPLHDITPETDYYILEPNEIENFKPDVTVVANKKYLKYIHGVKYEEDKYLPPTASEWYPRCNSYYPYTEDVDAIHRVEHLQAAKKFLESFTTIKIDDQSSFDPYSEYDTHLKFLKSKPAIFLILGKPGIGEENLGRLLANYWKCVYIDPEVLINEEIESGSRAGQCIEFNLRCGRAIAADVILRLLEKRLNSKSTIHRGYVICGFPLIRNDMFQEDPLSSESAIFTVQDIFEELLEPIGESASQVIRNVSVISESIEELKEENEDKEGKGEDEGKEVESFNKDKAIKSVHDETGVTEIGSVLTADIGKSTKAMCKMTDISWNYAAQTNFLFSLCHEPIIIIYIMCPNYDVVTKHEHYRYNLKTDEMVNLLKDQTDSIVYTIFTTSPGFNTEDLPDDAPILPESSETPSDLSYLVYLPRNFSGNVQKQLEDYRFLTLPTIEKHVLLHDPQYFIKVDGRLSPNRMFNIVKTRMRLLPIPSVVIPEMLIEPIVPTGGEGDEVNVFDYESKSPLECFDKLKRMKIVGKMFKLNWSRWGTTCPVGMKEGYFIPGRTQFSVKFLNKIFCMSDENALTKFIRNPRPFLLPPCPRSNCKIFIIGPPTSGKSALAKCLAYLLDGTVLDTISLKLEYTNKKTKEYKEQLRNDAMNEGLLLLINLKQTDYLNKIQDQEAAIEKWKEEVNQAANDRIQLDEYIRSGTISELTSFPVKSLRELTETELTNYEDIIERLEAKMIELEISDLYENVEKCEEIIQGVVNIEDRLPTYLKEPIPEPEPSSIFDDFVKEYADEKVSKISPKTFDTNEDLVDMYLTAIKETEEKNLEAGLHNGGWIVDGMIPEPEILDVVMEEFYPNDIFLLNDNSERFLQERFKLRNQNLYEGYDKFFENITKPDIAVKVPSVTSTFSYKTRLAREIIDAALANEVMIQDEIVFPEQEEEYLPDYEDTGEFIDEDYFATHANRLEIMQYEKALNEFQRKIHTLISYLEEAGISYHLIDLADKSVEDIMKYVVKLVDNRYQYSATQMTPVEKLEEVDDFAESNTPGEGEEPSNSNAADSFSKNRRLGTTSIYCPVTFSNHWVLWKGKEEFACKYNDYTYLLATEKSMMDFIKSPLDYVLTKTPEKLPPPRICIVGVPGSGKTVLSRALHRHLGLYYLCYDELLKRIFHKEKDPREMGIVLMDVKDTPEALIVQNYLDNDDPFTDEIWKILNIEKLWVEEPMRSTGFVFDAFPRRPSDFNYIETNCLIPDIVIQITCEGIEINRRRVQKLQKDWQIMQEAKKKATEKAYMEEYTQWELIRKARIEELMEIKRQERYQAKIQQLKQTPLSTVEEVNEEEEDHFTSRSQVSYDSVAEAADLEEVTKLVDSEFPEPQLILDEETEDEAVDRFINLAQHEYVLYSDYFRILKESCQKELIEWVSIDGDMKEEKVLVQALRAVDKIKFRNKSAIQRCYDINVETAEHLISTGYYFLSRFGKACPVQLYEMANPMNMFLPLEQKFDIYPILHGYFIYFLAGKNNRTKFINNPLKYIYESDANFPLIPFRVAIIGPPKSGKTALAERFKRDFGMKYISIGQAARYTLRNLPFSKLTKDMEAVLRNGWELTSEMTMKCVEAMAFDGKGQTQGLVFDGFPNNKYDVIHLAERGLIPHLVLYLDADDDDMEEYRLTDKGKRGLPVFSKAFIRHRRSVWDSGIDAFLDWFDKEYQIYTKIKVKNCKWSIWDTAYKIAVDVLYEVKSYFKNCHRVMALHIANMQITPGEFLKRQSSFKHYCPVCLHYDNHLISGGNPPDRTGLIQYKEFFYWICRKHLKEFADEPTFFLSPYNNRPLPADLPQAIKLEQMPESVYQDGYCIVCYWNGQPSRVLNKGLLEYACLFRDIYYLFDSQECLDIFMIEPFLYFQKAIKYKGNPLESLDLNNLPVQGYLEQYVIRDVVKAVTRVGAVRPVVPGLGIEKSAAIALGIMLKAHNPKATPENREMYEKIYKLFKEKRLAFIDYLAQMKKSINPYLHYEEPLEPLVFPESDKGELTIIGEHGTPSGDSKVGSLTQQILQYLQESDARRVPVPDERFDYLCEYFKPASKVPAFLNVVDIAGLVKGASEGQGLGNAFLSHISACDAIFHLCRAFEDDDVTHIEGDVNPVRDLEIIGEELRLKDEEMLMKNLEKLERAVLRGGDKKLKPEYDTMAKVKTILVDQKQHIRFADWHANDIDFLNKYLFLTSKPMIYLVNLAEKDYIKKKNKWLVKIKEWVDKNDPGAMIIPFSGAFEQKLVEIEDPILRKKHQEDCGATSALDKIIVQGYKALQLEYFFTAGTDEVKAWTIQKGTKAPQAAGRIHTDFEKGFIMAEVMKFVDFKEEGSEAAAKAAGKYRQQGRNYVVEDGDIIFFKFNAGAGLKDAKKK